MSIESITQEYIKSLWDDDYVEFDGNQRTKNQIIKNPQFDCVRQGINETTYKKMKQKLISLRR